MKNFTLVFKRVFTVILISTHCFIFACKKKASFVVNTSLQNLKQIEIGEVQTLTGSEAVFGIAIHRGYEMAIQQINDQGGVNGVPLHLITLDDQGKPEEAATATAKLASENKVIAILGALSSSRSIAMAPIAQKNKIPMITPTGTNPKITQLGDYIFRTCFIDSFQGRILSKFAVDYLKLKKIAILTDIKSDYSEGLSLFFSKNFKERGGSIVSFQSYSTGDIDYKAQLTAIRSLNPDALFIPGYYTEVGLIVRQVRELGMTLPLLGTDGWSSEKTFEIAGEALNNSYYTDHYSNKDQSLHIQHFIKKFKLKYGTIPDGIAALGYDTMMLLKDAISRTKVLNCQNLRQAIAQTQNFQGVTGKITFDNERNPIKSAVILKIDQGATVYLTTLAP